MHFVDRILSLQGNYPVNKVRGVSDLDLCIVFGPIGFQTS